MMQTDLIFLAYNMLAGEEGRDYVFFTKIDSLAAMLINNIHRN